MDVKFVTGKGGPDTPARVATNRVRLAKVWERGGDWHHPPTRGAGAGSLANLFAPQEVTAITRDRTRATRTSNADRIVRLWVGVLGVRITTRNVPNDSATDTLTGGADWDWVRNVHRRRAG